MTDQVVFDGENFLEIQRFIESTGRKKFEIGHRPSMGRPYCYLVKWMNRFYRPEGILINPGDLLFVNDDGQIETVEHPGD